MVTHMDSGSSSEDEDKFWCDVNYYMNQYKCDKEAAKREIEKIYDNYSKNRNTKE